MKSLLIVIGAGLLFFLSLPAFSAPTIDGVMNDWTSDYYYSDTDEWTIEGNEYFSAEEGGADGGHHYDVEMLGLYISDSVLYFGLHTDFDLVNGYEASTPGEFALDFGSDDTFEASFSMEYNSTTTRTIQDYDASIDGFNANDVDLRLKLADSPFPSEDWLKTTSSPQYGYKIENWSSEKTFENAGSMFVDNSNVYNDSYTLEAAVDLQGVNEALGNILTDNNSLRMYWTMSCGNDILSSAVAYEYDDFGTPTPEPSTYVLLGSGLIGLGLLKRRKTR